MGLVLISLMKPQIKSELVELQLRIKIKRSQLVKRDLFTRYSSVVDRNPLRSNHAAGVDTTILLPQWAA